MIIEIFMLGVGILASFSVIRMAHTLHVLSETQLAPGDSLDVQKVPRFTKIHLAIVAFSVSSVLFIAVGAFGRVRGDIDLLKLRDAHRAESNSEGGVVNEKRFAPALELVGESASRHIDGQAGSWGSEGR